MHGARYGACEVIKMTGEKEEEEEGEEEEAWPDAGL